MSMANVDVPLSHFPSDGKHKYTYLASSQRKAWFERKPGCHVVLALRHHAKVTEAGPNGDVQHGTGTSSPKNWAHHAFAVACLLRNLMSLH